MNADAFRRMGVADLRGASKAQENGHDPCDDPAPHADSTEYPDGAGRNDKHPQQGFYLMRPGQCPGECERRGIMYAWIDQEPVLDVRMADGKLVESLTFGYEMRSGHYDVTIRGRNLAEIYDKLMMAKR